MPRPMTEAEREAFVAAPRVAVLSVANGERPPSSAPTWYAYEPGGLITFFTGTDGRKARKTQLIRDAGVVSMVVQETDPDYRYVTVEGSVERIDHPPSPDQLFTIVRRYMSDDHAMAFADAELRNAGPELVLISIRPDRWLSADFSE